jgi:conjugal transfer pilus assembly protein TraK
MIKTKWLSSLALCLTFGASQTFALEDIPVVPASVMKKTETEKAVLVPSASAVAVHLNESPVLTMAPGVNQIIPIAIGHPNRIVTPFSHPEVTSTSLVGSQKAGECGEICIKENIVYVATSKDYPVTMFITEKGSEAQALNLTMIPRRIPPREIFLKLDIGTVMSGMYVNHNAERWEESQPYLETIRSIFRKLAVGEIPQGYTLSRIPAGAATPSCAHPNLEVDFTNGQYLMGHHLNVFVGVARNTSARPIEFKEALCGNWDVAAVAAWPRNVIAPGQKAEIFVAKKQKRGAAPTSRRPSLLGGNS